MKNEKIETSDPTIGVGVRIKAEEAGEGHLEMVATTGDGDHKVTVYRFPQTGILVADTNGDPVWQESDPVGFSDLLEEVGIVI